MTNMDYSEDISKCVILSDFPSIPFDSNLDLLILSHHTTFFGAENTLHNVTKTFFYFQMKHPPRQTLEENTRQQQPRWRHIEARGKFTQSRLVITCQCNMFDVEIY